MQRDMAVVKYILEALADAIGGVRGYHYVLSDLDVAAIAEYDESSEDWNHIVRIPSTICSADTLFYHLCIMEEQGLIISEGATWQGYYLVSWEGNEFLQALRQEGVFDALVAKHKDGWRTLPFEVLRFTALEIGKALALKSVGL